MSCAPICGASGASCRAGAASPSSTAPGTVACWSSASRSWPAADWRRAYAEINDFEEQLSGSGALVLKFWLAVTPDVQLERFKEREKSPFKNFKITPDDWRNRDKWKEYAAATNEMLTRTDVAHAPWHLISANDKRYARLQVLRHIVEALENPR